MFVFLDTPFDRACPVYTRANAGEILPHPLTPLAWSVIGPGFEEGFRISFCDDFSALPRPGHDTPFLLVGRFAARFHLNLSALRITADRLPGTSADVVDLQYFGDAAATGLPDHRPHPDDRRFRLKTPAAMGRTLAGVGRRVDRDRTRVDDLVARAGEHLGDPDADLVRLLREAMGTFGVVLGTHVTARALTSPLLEQATHALERAGVAAEDALRHVSSIPDLESAKPSRRLAEIARAVPAGSELAAVVARCSMAELAASSTPGAAELHADLRRFVDDFGHRGVGEFDPTRPAWAQQPDDVVTLLARLGDAVPTVTAPPDVDPGRVARPLVAAARSAMFRAERTKDTCMRVTDVLRRIVFALEERWRDDVDPTLLRMCTVEELEARANGAGLPLVAELERRRTEFDRACAVEVAEWSDGAITLVNAGASPAADPGSGPDDILVGIAGSPGVAVGRARVLADPYDDFEDGDILVAAMTDTAWTPLFLAAGAVVTDVGGVLSHATIVARDLGIPAVVNTKLATTAIPDGARVEVDGSTGRVTVLDRP